MRKYSILTAFIVAGLLSGPFECVAASFDEVLRASTIAVEMRSNRPAPYDFSGVVGSLQVDLEHGLIDIIEVSAPYKVKLSVEQFRIVEIESFPDSIDFTCQDRYGATWRGKIYYSKTTEHLFGVEIVRRDSPRKIVNMTERGKQFLADHAIGHIDFGI